MNLREVVESLLWEAEGTELDFKRDQYPFANASDDAKSEILKDILAFANAWRRSDAYILVGVDEVRGGRSIPRGVSDHLGEAQLQQFVNSKTQRPVTFSYRPVEIDGVSVGVMHIPVQDRPIYAVRRFGRVDANVVYVRRGSSTEIAKPDEIASMRSAAATPAGPLLVPEIELEPIDITEFRVAVYIKSLSSIAPQQFRIIVEVPDDFAHPTINFEREVRHENGYRFCETDQSYFPQGILESDRVLVQKIHFKVPAGEWSGGRRLQKAFRVTVKANGMTTQTFEQQLARVLQYPNV